jgi:glucose-6-phosphate 1-dehydrogenase
MEPPAAGDNESIRDEKVKVLKAIPSLDPHALVRGQYRGYTGEAGVSPGSTVETFAALRLQIQSWRWQGVPFILRAGKRLPVTSTEVIVRLRRPPPVYAGRPPANHFRFRLSPEATIAVGAMVKKAGEELAGEAIELLVSHENPQETDAYEQLLSDAMQGEPFHFAREDHVEEAWRIVQPALDPGLPVVRYEPGTWGPPAAAALAAPGTWHDPRSAVGPLS